jgi:hypothetical protein
VSLARLALFVSWFAAGCAAADVDSLDKCSRTSCDDQTVTGTVGAGLGVTGTPTSTTGSGGRAGAAGAGGNDAAADAGSDAGRSSSTSGGAGGATGGSGTGSGGSSGSGDDAGSDAATRDAPKEVTTVDAGPDPTARCPSNVDFNNFTATTEHGMPQNGPTSTDLCPDGQALVGYGLSATTPSNFTTAIMSKIEPSCGKLAVAADGSGCKIVVSPGAALPTRGRYSNGATKQTCPRDQIIVTFKGRSGRDIDQLGFGCAPLEVTRVGSDYRVSLGSVTSLGTVGGTGGSAFQDGCPSGRVAVGNKITDENGFIGAFGLICASITLVP